MSLREVISILGVEQNILSEEPGLLDYHRYFLEAYCEDSCDIGPDRHLEVTIQRGCLPVLVDAQTRPVHKSKHAYWTFDAEVLNGPTLLAVWPSRGLSVTIDKESNHTTVTVGKETPALLTGEALFHLSRSLALYTRAGFRGNFLHASAVEARGNAIAFLGGSASGKTTLMTETVLRLGGNPLANDRVLLTCEELPEVISWPSYASFCEGTLLRYPELASAAIEYESDVCPYKTQSWPRAIEPIFTRERKRIYPMIWFRNAVGRSYVRRSPLGALVFTNVGSGVTETHLRRLNIEDPLVLCHLEGLLAKQCFDYHEPSFCNWHGLRLPSGAPPLEDLILRIRAAGIGVYQLSIHVDSLEALPDLISSIIDEVGT